MTISCFFILQIPVKKERKIWYRLASNHFLTVRPIVHSCQARWETDPGMPSLTEPQSYNPIPHLWTHQKLQLQIKVVLMYNYAASIRFIFGCFKILTQKTICSSGNIFSNGQRQVYNFINVQPQNGLKHSIYLLKTLIIICKGGKRFANNWITSNCLHSSLRWHRWTEQTVSRSTTNFGDACQCSLQGIIKEYTFDFYIKYWLFINSVL